jgi:hypothetical protein
MAKTYELFATEGIASEWLRDVTSGGYKAWIDRNYAYRIAV